MAAPSPSSPHILAQRGKHGLLLTDEIIKSFTPHMGPYVALLRPFRWACDTLRERTKNIEDPTNDRRALDFQTKLGEKDKDDLDRAFEDAKARCGDPSWLTIDVRSIINDGLFFFRVATVEGAFLLSTLFSKDQLDGIEAAFITTERLYKIDGTEDDYATVTTFVIKKRDTFRWSDGKEETRDDKEEAEGDEVSVSGQVVDCCDREESPTKRSRKEYTSR